jgi:hypothetical protein
MPMNILLSDFDTKSKLYSPYPGWIVMSTEVNCRVQPFDFWQATLPPLVFLLSSYFIPQDPPLSAFPPTQSP